MRSIKKEWLDNDGLLHLNRYPEINDTINAPLFTGTYICLKYANGKLTIDDVGEFLYAISHLYKGGKWRTHSASTVDRFAHDNFTGVITGLVCCRKYLESLAYETKEIDKWIDRIPFYHHNADHPRDFIFYNYVKRPWLFFWLLPLVSLTMLTTCYQTHKIRKGRMILKTDGKIMALIRGIACMPRTLKLCSWLIEKKKHQMESGLRFTWLSWWYVMNEYYKNSEHPNLREARIYVEL